MTTLEVAPQAEAQIRRIAAWWRENRSAAPSRFPEELADALESLVANPGCGTLYGERRGVKVRRLLMRGTGHHVYFSYDRELDLVSVRAVWHGARGSGPRLG